MVVKRLMLLFMAVLPVACLMAQNAPQEVTPEIARKINAEIDKGIIKLKEGEKNEKLSPEELAFRIDTFKIEQFFRRDLDYNYTTSGMNSATFDAADKYDSLLNKYYKLLLNKLVDGDKNTLKEAQRAWLAYREKEMKLVELLGQEQYSGGGTMQILIYAGKYLAFIKARVNTLFDYYSTIIESTNH